MHQAARHGDMHVLRVFARPLRDAARSAPLPGVDVRPLGEEELVAWRRDPELDLREGMIREVYRRGDRCLGALYGAALVGYVWFAYGIAPHVDGIWVKVPPRVVYRFKAFVRASYRGRGIAPALYDAADPLIAKPGLDTVVDCIALQNRPSIAATLRSGSRPLGAVGYWRVGSRFLSFHSPAVRRLGLRFYRASS